MTKSKPDDERELEAIWQRAINANSGFIDRLPDGFTLEDLLRRPPSQFELFVGNPELVRPRPAVLCFLQTDNIRLTLREVFFIETLIEKGAFYIEDGEVKVNQEAWAAFGRDAAYQAAVRDFIKTKEEQVFLGLWATVQRNLQPTFNRITTIAHAEVNSIIKPQTRSVSKMIDAFFREEKKAAKRRFPKRRRGPAPEWTKGELRASVLAAIGVLKEYSKRVNLEQVADTISRLDSKGRKFNKSTLQKRLDKLGLDWMTLKKNSYERKAAI